MAQITKEQILAKIAEKKRVAQLEAARQRRSVQRPSQTVLQESGRRVAPRVIRETKATPAKSLSLNEAIAQRTKGLDKVTTHKMTTLAENIYNHNRAFMEATQAGLGVTDVVANGAGVGLVKTYFDIFFGYFPNLIAPLIASTQPIKTPNAVVFYYQAVAGSAKGEVATGEVLIDPFKLASAEEYTSQRVTIAKNVASPVWGPLVPRSVTIEGQEITWSSDTAGTFGTAGTVAVAVSGGNITVTLGGADAADVEKVTYLYDNVYAPTQVPELNANVVEKQISAKTRTLKTNFSFQAGYGFEAQFGVKLDDKLAESAMYELKREIDLEIIGKALSAAPALVTWNKNTAASAIGNYESHKLSFMDAIIGASNHIFSISKRVRGNILVVGIDAQTIVETLPAFKGEDFGSQIGGPSVIGTLKGITVIATPDLPRDEFLVLFKDKKDDLNAGIIFAPYLPVFATQPVMLDDFLWRRAFAESHGTLVVNPDYFVRGRITNDPTGLPVQLMDRDGNIYDGEV